MKRRAFIQKASAFIPLTIASTGLIPGRAKRAIGLQLYTLRDTISKDPKGVLQKVADLGYKELETFAYADGGTIFGMPFQDFGKFTKDLGMKVTSGHYSLDQAKSSAWEQAVTDAKSIGQDYLVVAYLEEGDRKSIDDYKKVCDALNKAGEVCNKNGLRFGYHNHAFEFATLNGQVPYNIMMKALDPKLVSMELDIYWVYRAGKDPLQLFQQYPGRFEQWHVKDMDKTNKDRNADIGTGTVDWKLIFGKAKQSGMKHFYIEQETYPGAPIDSAATGIKNLKAIL